MTIKAELLIEACFARANISGRYDFAEATRVVHAAVEFAETEGKETLLFDVRGLTGRPPTTMQRYDHGVDLAKKQRQHPSVQAVAIAGHPPIIESERFVQLIATSSGANVKAFDDFREAVDWIEAEATRLDHLRGPQS